MFCLRVTFDGDIIDSNESHGNNLFFFYRFDLAGHWFVKSFFVKCMKFRETFLGNPLNR